MAMEEDTQMNNSGISAAVRTAKKAIRPTKIGLPEGKLPTASKKLKAKKARKASKVGFASDLGSKREGARAKKSDTVKGLVPKKPKVNVGSRKKAKP
jgi:ATP-dependent RNA helicase DDX27